MDGGDVALGVRIGKRHIKLFQNGLGDHAQAGSLGFPMNAALGIRLIDGPSQVVPTHQVPMGAENQQRQETTAGSSRVVLTTAAVLGSPRDLKSTSPPCTR